MKPKEGGYIIDNNYFKWNRKKIWKITKVRTIKWEAGSLGQYKCYVTDGTKLDTYFFPAKELEYISDKAEDLLNL